MHELCDIQDYVLLMVNIYRGTGIGIFFIHFVLINYKCPLTYNNLPILTNLIILIDNSSHGVDVYNVALSDLHHVTNVMYYRVLLTSLE